MKKVNRRPNNIGLRYIFKNFLWEKKKGFDTIFMRNI